GWVVCTQHECMCPNELGDLQKGEHYINMVFVVIVSLAGLNLLLLMISYDIASQWKIHLKVRLGKLPEDMQLPPDVKLQCTLLVWYARSHNNNFQNKNSLSFKPRIGKSDGKGIERNGSG
ncbi:hypothetical protein DFH08DRAFT_717637, partial [Mycena albidolilacea]